MLDFIVDKNLCNQCGLCVDDCPVSIIELNDYPSIKREESCIHCQHCLAICPHGAISILGKDPNMSSELRENFPTKFQMATLIKGRRSFRSYKRENVDEETIREILTVSAHAPTGRNTQQVFLTIINDFSKTETIRDKIYQMLPGVLDTNQDINPWMIKYLRWAQKMWQKKGEDPIFMGAPHAIIASVPKTAATGLIDSHIYLAYFELMAQSMGLGTLWNGILTAVFANVLPDLRNSLGIPDDHEIGYALVFGYARVQYERTVQREAHHLNFVK